MTDQHPIVPSFELRNQWHSERPFKNMVPSREREDYMVDRAAQWGADQELEACCSEIGFITTRATADNLRSLRRPKPPSLKEQALESLTKIEDNKATYLDASIVRSALEALPND